MLRLDDNRRPDLRLPTYSHNQPYGLRKTLRTLINVASVELSEFDDSMSNFWSHLPSNLALFMTITSLSLVHTFSKTWLITVVIDATLAPARDLENDSAAYVLQRRPTVNFFRAGGQINESEIARNHATGLQAG